MENNRYNLGYFLEYDFWNQAIKMLDCQLKGKSKAWNKKNKKVLLPLNFKYFDKISAEYEGIINKEKYFKERIANNFFYGLDKEFFIYEYQKSKSSFGLRNYYFFSYPLILVHYCIGIYLLKLSQKFMDEICKLNNDNQKCYEKSYYGGKLRFDFKNNSLLFNNAYERFYYLQHYKEFKMDIKKEMNDTSNKVVIKMDIANYYDNIDIRWLLYYLDECIDDETKWDLNFDEYTKDQISFFYEFIMKDKIGIPQSDNNIVSDFIGYLYLFFADMFIIDEIGRNIDVEQFKLIRYVDDIYIVLKYGEATSNVESFDYEELRKASVKVLSKTSDLLYYKFGLKLNNKTKIYLVEKEEEKKEFLKNFKKVSVDRV